MKLNYHLRPATQDDFELVLEIKSRSLRPYIEQVWGWEENFQREYLKEHYQPEHTQIIEQEGQAIGFLHHYDRQDELFISEILIMDRFQGQGIGKDIIESQMEFARGKNKAVSLYVLEVNPRARALYERLGFEVVATDLPRLLMRFAAP